MIEDVNHELFPGRKESIVKSNTNKSSMTFRLRNADGTSTPYKVVHDSGGGHHHDDDLFSSTSSMSSCSSLPPEVILGGGGGGGGVGGGLHYQVGHHPSSISPAFFASVNFAFVSLNSSCSDFNDSCFSFVNSPTDCFISSTDL